MDDMQGAAGYIRVDGAPADSVEAQKNEIQSFAKNRGIDLRSFYIDHADATVSLGERNGYQSLNNDILSGKVSTVITPSFDQLTKDTNEKQSLIHTFAEKGVDVFITSTGEYINPSDPITREQRLIAEAMRDMEDIKAHRVREDRQKDGRNPNGSKS